ILGGLGGWATAVARIAQVLGFDPGKRPNVLHLARIVCVALPLVGLGLCLRSLPAYTTFITNLGPRRTRSLPSLKRLRASHLIRLSEEALPLSRSHTTR